MRKAILGISKLLFAIALGALSLNVACQTPSKRIDRQFIRKTVEGLAATVQREYFDADVAARVGETLKKRLAEGAYADVSTVGSLANVLTRDLLAVTKDKHLAVAVVPEAKSAGDSAKRARPSREVRGRRENWGVKRVEILAGNVGYLNLTQFYRPEEARDALSAAMGVLQNADAIILDMRSNGGGSPGTVALLASYFFDTPELPLFRIVSRSGESRRYSTEKTPPQAKKESRPVFVLTSKRTFSAGEGMTFLLQERRRAEIVGEITAGAANLGRPYRINSRLVVTVPNGKVESAITKGNWEGRGVQPDVQAQAADALRVAHLRALRRLEAKAKKDGK